MASSTDRKLDSLRDSTALNSSLRDLRAIVETSDVSDAFSELNEKFVKLFNQIWNPVYFLTTVLHNPTGRSAFSYVQEDSDKTPTEIGNNIYNQASELHTYCTGLYTSNNRVTFTFDPTRVTSLDFTVNKDDIPTIAPFFKELGINLDASGNWSQQSVAMNLEQYKGLKFDPERFPLQFEGDDEDSEGGGYNQPTIDPDVQSLIDDVGIDFSYRWVFKPANNSLGKEYSILEGSLHLESLITVPTDFFHWLNGSLGAAGSAKTKFPFTLASDYVAFACHAYGDYISWPIQITTPEIVKQRLDTFSTGVAGFQPRVNERGWCITPAGGFFKPSGLNGDFPQRHGELLVERQDRLDAVLAQISNLSKNGALDAETSAQIAALQKEAEIIEKSYAGRITVVDWINDKMHRYTSDGAEELVDLTGTRALDPVTELITLNKSITDSSFSVGQRSFIATMMARVHEWGNDHYVAGVNNGTLDANDPSAFPPDVNRAFAQLINQNGPKTQICVKHLMGIDIDNDFEDTPNGKAIIDWLTTVGNAIRAAVKDPTFLPLNRFNEYTQSTMLGYFVDTIGRMSPETFAAIKASSRVLVQKNAPAPVWDPKAISVPNIQIRPGQFDSVMPHQADGFRTLFNFPGAALIDISAGGGKTSIAIIEILKMIDELHMERPLVITAGNLVPSFITEINSLTNGKINAVPLRVEILRTMIERLEMKSVADFVRWVRSFPPNTIFVAAYTDFTSRSVFFDDFEAPIAYGTCVEETFQYRQIMAAIGFQYVMIDESQFAKNRQAARTKGAAYMLSRADYRRPASGTMLNNTVLDLFGQVSISVNGAVLGSMEHFTTKYSIASGMVQDASKAIELRRDIRQSSALITKRRKDWAFLMPDITAKFFPCKMTEVQTAYYDKLMTELVIEIRRELEKLKAKNKDMSEEELEARIISMLQYRLAKVEQFLVAPDLNKDFSDPEDGSKPALEDLVSPQVYTADQRIDAHLAAGRTDKIIIFGYHKAASAHFMKHSRHANKCIRYTAGDLDAIEKFKDPKGPFILVADENSMKQGFNLQIAGRIIRLQAVWAPGDYEQALSRMYRPDPRGIFNRTHVDEDWILPLKFNGEATLAVAKTARMISKAISNAQVSNNDDMEWRKISDKFDDLPLLSMNLELVFNFKLDEAGPYFKGWDTMNGYESKQMTAVRRNMAAQIEARNPGLNLLNPDGTVANVALFTQHVMIPITEAPAIAGSKMVHVPWIETAQPADPHNLGLVLGSNYPHDVLPKEYCITEFGPGQIQVVRENSAKVKTAVGIVTVPWNTLALLEYDPSDEAGYKARRLRLKTMFLNINNYALIPPGMQPDATMMGPSPGRAGAARIINDPKPALPNPGAAQPADNTPVPAPGLGTDTLDLQCGVLNGFPTLFSKDLNLRDFLVSLHDGWTSVPQFISVTFTNWKGAKNFLDALDQNFWIDQVVASKLRAGLADMQRGKEIRADTIPNSGLVRNFFTATHRKLPAKQGWPTVMPFWVTEGHNVRLAFSRLALDPAATRWLAGPGRKVAGVRKIAVNDGMLVNFFKSPRNAAAMAKATVAAAKAKGVTVDVPQLNEQMMAGSKIIQTMRRNTSQFADDLNPSATGVKRGK